MKTPSRYFKLQEFVPKSIYDKYGSYSTRFVSPILFDIAHGVRKYFDSPVTINNWSYGGNRMYSGYRTPRCTIGAPQSAHRRGMAIDILIKDLPAPDVQKVIKDNYHDFFKGLGITAIEDGTKTWTHLSCENFNSDELVIIPFY